MVLGHVALPLQGSADVDRVRRVQEAGALVPAHHDAVGALERRQVVPLPVDGDVVAHQRGVGRPGL